MNFFSKIKAAFTGGSTDQVSEGPPSSSPKIEAAKILDLDAMHVGYAKQIKATSKESFALRVLNLTLEEYRWYMDFKGKSTAQKIHSFIPTTDSFAQYLSICYAKYTEFKKEDRGGWKYFDHSQHLAAARTLLDELIGQQYDNNMEFLNKAAAATRHLFFAVYTKRYGKKHAKIKR